MKTLLLAPGPKCGGWCSQNPIGLGWVTELSGVPQNLHHLYGATHLFPEKQRIHHGHQPERYRRHLCLWFQQGTVETQRFLQGKSLRPLDVEGFVGCRSRLECLRDHATKVTGSHQVQGMRLLPEEH